MEVLEDVEARPEGVRLKARIRHAEVNGVPQAPEARSLAQAGVRGGERAAFLLMGTHAAPFSRRPAFLPAAGGDGRRAWPAAGTAHVMPTASVAFLHFLHCLHGDHLF